MIVLGDVICEKSWHYKKNIPRYLTHYDVSHHRFLTNQASIKQYIVHFLAERNVESYRPLVTEYAQEYNVEEHVHILLAMMMQESGGRGNDPMQSSESLCGHVGCIEDPEQSIEQGIAYFADAVDLAKGDVELAVQSYNFGLGFTHYVHKHHDTFNEAVTIEFSQKMYEEADDPSVYTCLREEAKQYDACYGDIYYVRDVMNYKERFVQ